MPVREQPAVRIDRQVAVRSESALGERRSGFARLDEAEVLEIDQERDGEAIVDERQIDVGALYAGLRQGSVKRGAGAKRGQ